jgi:hypothetical protein
VKEDEVGWICSTNGKIRHKILFGNMKRRGHLEDLSVKGRIR